MADANREFREFREFREVRDIFLKLLKLPNFLNTETTDRLTTDENPTVSSVRHFVTGGNADGFG